MKYRDLETFLVSNGWEYQKSSGRHAIFKKGDRRLPVPRHREINELTARNIIKEAGR